MLRSYIIFVCLSILPVSAYSQTAKINLKKLIKICESYEKSITDVNMEFTFEVNSVPPKNPPQNYARTIWPVKCYFSAIKPFDQLYRMTDVVVGEDAKGNRFGDTVTEACNGSIYKASRSPVTDKKPLAYTARTPLGFTIFNQVGESETLLDVLENRSNYYIITLDPNISKVNDFNVVEVTCIPYYGHFPQATINLFFSVDHKYTIVRIVSSVEAGNNDVLQLKNLGNNIWFPTKASIIIVERGFRSTFTVSKIAINTGLTKDDLLSTQKQDNKSSP